MIVTVIILLGVIFVLFVMLVFALQTADEFRLDIDRVVLIDDREYVITGFSSAGSYYTHGHTMTVEFEQLGAWMKSRRIDG